MCTKDRETYFENEVIKNMITTVWKELPNKYNNIRLDEYVIMPNHLHGII
ncbi:transposase, partial [Candidatus Omnitrophota bacterium]